MNIFIMKSVYFKELYNEQEYYCPAIYRAGTAVVSTISSLIIIYLFVYLFIEDITQWREDVNFIFGWPNNILRTSAASE